MKTFEEEKSELATWFQKAYSEAEKEIEQLPPIDGFDDRGTAITRPIIEEWNRRIVELKKKYGKSQDIQSPMTKGRTFNQVLHDN